MRSIVAFLTTFLFAISINAQKTGIAAQPDTTKKIIVAEAACGQCQFGMIAKGCNLAVRINGKSYFVDGTTIDDHGDAHASDGFCEAIRKAEVQGEIVNERFRATYFKLVKVPKEKPAKTGSGG